MLEDTREALALTAQKHGLGKDKVAQLLAEYDLTTAEIKVDPSPKKAASALDRQVSITSLNKPSLSLYARFH